MSALHWWLLPSVPGRPAPSTAPSSRRERPGREAAKRTVIAASAQRKAGADATSANGTRAGRNPTGPRCAVGVARSDGAALLVFVPAHVPVGPAVAVLQLLLGAA